MTPYFIGTTILLVLAQLALPRKLAFLPLVIAGYHVGNRELLPELTPARLLIFLGLGRAIAGGFMAWPSSRNKLDVVFMIFSAAAIISTVGHKPDQYFPSPLNARVGLVLNVVGVYLYGRAYLTNVASFKRYALAIPFILLPLAAGLAYEKQTRQNVYFFMGGRSSTPVLRDGKTRASGPFQHPILAGCSGATALPLAYLLWRWGRRKIAIMGVIASLIIVLSCASSGPLAAVAVTLAAIYFWRWRHKLKTFLWTGIFLALVYNLIKGRGPWYLMASIDLVGGSTGWHRAKLIDQGFKYLNEWWLFGTDYTRHWMASGVRWNPNMVDLTNYFLHLGVTGGLPLTLCLVGFLVVAFRMLARRMVELREQTDADEIILWCAGTSLATHAVSFISISYFDQMYIFFYLLLGAIPGLVATAGSGAAIQPQPEPRAEPQGEEEPRLIPRYYS